MNNLLQVKDDLYQIIRTMKVNKDLNSEELKKQLLCDKVFSKEDYYYFVRKIDEAVITDEEPYQIKYKALKIENDFFEILAETSEEICYLDKNNKMEIFQKVNSHSIEYVSA